MITLFVLCFMLLSDLYIIRILYKLSRNKKRKYFQKAFQMHSFVSLVLLSSFIGYRYYFSEFLPFYFRQIVSFLFIAIYFSKTYWIFFSFIEDVGLLSLWIIRILRSTRTTSSTLSQTPKISRQEFLTQLGLWTTALPVGVSVYGITTAVYDYHLKHQKIILPHLPKTFEGLRIVQISDIHAGSFFNKKAVMGGIELILAQKPDIIFFTGDLVNYDTSEVKDYIPLFQKLKAPKGVFSVLGNHDYGDYRFWKSWEDKNRNLQDMIAAHQHLGWRLLIDEAFMLQEHQEQIAILGVGNWSRRGTFPKYGKLSKAYNSASESSVKLLLSHDPSHWDAQIRQYADIDVTFSGHTHGSQLGLSWGESRWSPIQYLYEQWSGLYQKSNQYIYVNQGFGYSDIFPLRLGMPPEITVIELSKEVKI